MKTTTLLALATALPSMALADAHMEASGGALSYGERPFYLIEAMEDGPLKDKLMSCQGQTPERSAFSIAHRGAPLMIPEHTKQSYVAGARLCEHG